MDIERIRAKQLAFRELKAGRALDEQSKDEFTQYINSLPKDNVCRYMTGISGIINLCSSRFNCRFKGELYKSFTNDPKKECLRQRMLRFERMLEH
ncbi:hypothetical protein KY358_00940 [Candidatus Woesearchaeota archaeon]|nr:hypothetical protein [Candidatus Woesearchaeota archaeon]